MAFDFQGALTNTQNWAQSALKLVTGTQGRVNQYQQPITTQDHPLATTYKQVEQFSSDVQTGIRQATTPAVTEIIKYGQGVASGGWIPTPKTTQPTTLDSVFKSPTINYQQQKPTPTPYIPQQKTPSGSTFNFEMPKFGTTSSVTEPTTPSYTQPKTTQKQTTSIDIGGAAKNTLDWLGGAASGGWMSTQPTLSQQVPVTKVETQAQTKPQYTFSLQGAGKMSDYKVTQSDLDKINAEQPITIKSEEWAQNLPMGIGGILTFLDPKQVGVQAPSAAELINKAAPTSSFKRDEKALWSAGNIPGFFAKDITKVTDTSTGKTTVTETPSTFEKMRTGFVESTYGQVLPKTENISQEQWESSAKAGMPVLYAAEAVGVKEPTKFVAGVEKGIYDWARNKPDELVGTVVEGYAAGKVFGGLTKLGDVGKAAAITDTTSTITPKIVKAYDVAQKAFAPAFAATMVTGTAAESTEGFTEFNVEKVAPKFGQNMFKTALTLGGMHYGAKSYTPTKTEIIDTNLRGTKTVAAEPPVGGISELITPKRESITPVAKPKIEDVTFSGVSSGILESQNISRFKPTDTINATRRATPSEVSSAVRRARPTIEEVPFGEPRSVERVPLKETPSAISQSRFTESDILKGVSDIFSTKRATVETRKMPTSASVTARPQVNIVDTTTIQPTMSADLMKSYYSSSGRSLSEIPEPFKQIQRTTPRIEDYVPTPAEITQSKIASQKGYGITTDLTSRNVAQEDILKTYYPEGKTGNILSGISDLFGTQRAPEPIRLGSSASISQKVPEITEAIRNADTTKIIDADAIRQQLAAQIPPKSLPATFVESPQPTPRVRRTRDVTSTKRARETPEILKLKELTKDPEKEWLVITDKNMNVIFKEMSPTNDATVPAELYEKGLRVAADAGVKEVYTIHTHPSTDKIQMPTRSASAKNREMGDMAMDAYLEQRSQIDYGVNVIGTGVITERGVSMYKPGTPSEILPELHRESVKTKFKEYKRDNTDRSYYQALESARARTEQELVDVGAIQKAFIRTPSASRAEVRPRTTIDAGASLRQKRATAKLYDFTRGVSSDILGSTRGTAQQAASAVIAPEAIRVKAWRGTGQEGRTGVRSGAKSQDLGERFATNDYTYASGYAKGGVPGEVEVVLNNPYHMSREEFYQLDRGKSAITAKERRDYLESKGYDGIVVDQTGGVLEYITFNKQQITPSTIGQFGGKKRNIEKQVKPKRPHDLMNSNVLDIVNGLSAQVPQRTRKVKGYKKLTKKQARSLEESVIKEFSAPQQVNYPASIEGFGGGKRNTKVTKVTKTIKNKHTSSNNTDYGAWGDIAFGAKKKPVTQRAKKKPTRRSPIKTTYASAIALWYGNPTKTSNKKAN